MPKPSRALLLESGGICAGEGTVTPSSDRHEWKLPQRWQEGRGVTGHVDGFLKDDMGISSEPTV